MGHTLNAIPKFRTKKLFNWIHGKMVKFALMFGAAFEGMLAWSPGRKREKHTYIISTMKT